MSIVKNTPSMSPRFRGFDFKEARRARHTPRASRPAPVLHTHARHEPRSAASHIPRRSAT